MTEIDKIKDRFSDGYSIELYENNEALHEQMMDDINSLIILFDALNSVKN